MVVEVHRVTFIVSGARKRPDPQQPKKIRTMKPSIHNYSGLRPVHGKARALFAASSLGILLALPAGAATVIPVTNHSFEAQVIAEGGANFSAPTGWTYLDASYGGGRAMFNPDNAYFTGSTSGTPAGADGSNVLSTSTGNVGNIAGVYQTIAGTSLTAGQTYTMTVAIGDYKTLLPNRWHLAISTSSMAAENFLGSFLAVYSPTNGNELLTDDMFKDFSVQYTATGSESQIGQNLRITIWAQNHGTEGGTHVVFDNVRLTSMTAIPEPSAALLGGIGLLALLRRRR